MDRLLALVWILLLFSDKSIGDTCTQMDRGMCINDLVLIDACRGSSNIVSTHPQVLQNGSGIA